MSIAERVDRGQQFLRSIKFSRIPFVAAVSGYALGGGCELALHASAIQAFSESFVGLVETQVGLVPAWGGCKELLIRLSEVTADPGALSAAAFSVVRPARVSSSAFDARGLGFLKPADGLTMNRDRLLADAKSRALKLAENYSSPRLTTLVLPGAAGADSLIKSLNQEREAGKLSQHDCVIGLLLIHILCGGESARAVTEDDIFALEKAAFVELFETSLTQERIAHLLKTGKPLRN